MILYGKYYYIYSRVAGNCCYQRSNNFEVIVLTYESYFSRLRWCHGHCVL